MGVRIDEIDYDEIVTKASNIAQNANDMQNSVNDALRKISQMREVWFGHSYDNFLDVVNMSIPMLNDIFEKSVSEIPEEIARKAKSYAKSNQHEVSVSMNYQTPLILKDLVLTNKGSKERFQEDNVRSHEKEINAKLTDAKSSANKALATAKSLESVWQSISGNKNIQELEKAFNNLIKIIDNYTQKLVNQIEAQVATISAIETAAEQIKAAPQVVEGAIDSVASAADAATKKIQESANQLWLNLTKGN